MKKVLALALALVMVLGVFACTQGTGTTTAPTDGGSQSASTGNELAGEYTIKIWCADAIVDLTKKQVEDFNATNTDGIKFNVTVEAVGEGDAATQMITDVEAGGDIFCFAQDQFARLIEAGALAKLGAKAAETVKAGNDADAVAAVTVNDDLYAYPITADNGFFMYYDKSVIPEDHIGSMEQILADCEAAGKYFSFDLGNGWYAPAFFFATGCVSEWFTDEDGKIDSVHDTFNSAEGLIAAKGMKKLVDSDMYLSASAVSGFSSNCAVVVSGTWDYTVASQILGDNLGAAELPSFEVDGKTYHLGSFNGFKLMGVKPQTDAKKAAALHKLAQYLSGEQAQLERFDAHGWGPSNLAALANEKVQAAPHIQAVMAQKNYATPQGQIHGSWWDIAKVIATEVKDATDEAGLKAALQHYYDSISSLFNMTEAELNAWGVIGAICGTNWDTDFPMTEVEPGVFQSAPLELKEGEQFKVRQGKSWDVNYGADCAPNGDNIVVPADDTYIVTLDTNAMTLTFVNLDGVLPEAAPVDPDAVDTWAVIGAICGTMWDTDFPMFDNKEVNLFQAVLPIHAGEEFKFRANGDWAKNIGLDDTGAAALNGQTNLTVEEDGTYYLAIDPEALTLTVEKVEVWGVIGGFAGSDWGTDMPMVETELGIWVSDPIALAAGNEYKLRANNDWAVNFGLTDGELLMGGKNIVVEADGTYVITLDLNARTITAVAQ